MKIFYILRCIEMSISFIVLALTLFVVRDLKTDTYGYLSNSRNPSYYRSNRNNEFSKFSEVFNIASFFISIIAPYMQSLTVCIFLTMFLFNLLSFFVAFQMKKLCEINSNGNYYNANISHQETHREMNNFNQCGPNRQNGEAYV
jgi:hypothetical protein